jgi:hypothetical protein
MLPTHGIPPYISSLRMRYHAAAAAQAFSSVLRTRPSQGSLTAATTLRMLQGNAGGGGASFLMPLVFDGIVNAGATPFQVRQACVEIRSSVYKAQQCFASGCSCTQPDSVYAHASMSHIQPPYLLWHLPACGQLLQHRCRWQGWHCYCVAHQWGIKSIIGCAKPGKRYRKGGRCQRRLAHLTSYATAHGLPFAL